MLQKIQTQAKIRRIFMSEEITEDFSAVDKVKAAKIMQKIIVEEATAIKSKGDDNASMVKKIQKMIEEEVQCY